MTKTLVERLREAESDWVELGDAENAEIARLSRERIEKLEAALATAERFSIGRDIVVEARGGGTWAVAQGGSVLAADGLWEWEPMPSSRTDDFIARTRFSLDEALDRARAAYKGE